MYLGNFNQVFGVALGALAALAISCGQNQSQSARLDVAPAAGIDLKMDLDKKMEAQPNKELAKVIKNQFSSTLNYLPGFPLRLKKTVTSEVGVTLSDMEMIPSRSVTKDTKNDLQVKTGIGSGGVTVSYSMVQKSYDITLFLEDNNGYMYTFHTMLTVNEKTNLVIKGFVSVDVLKVLPASIQKILAAFFDEVFSANGSSENTLNWEEKIAPSMLPIMDGEITEFQVQLIKDVLVPLCNNINSNYTFDQQLNCKVPALKTTSIDTALALKLEQHRLAVQGYETSPAAAATTNVQSQLTADPRLMPISYCEFTGKRTGFLGVWKQMLVYSKVEQPVLADSYYFYRLLSDKWAQPYDLQPLKAVENATPEKCMMKPGDKGSCVGFEWGVAIGVESTYKNLCDNIALNNSVYALSAQPNMLISLK